MIRFKMGLNAALHSSPLENDGPVSGLCAEDEEENRQPQLTLHPGPETLKNRWNKSPLWCHGV